MANFLINYNGKTYANRRFVEEMISYKIINKRLFQFDTVTVLDQVLLEITDDIKNAFIERRPNLQDIDTQLKGIKTVTAEQVAQAKKNMEMGFPNSYVITLPKSLMPPIYNFGGFEFYRYSEYKKQGNYSTKTTTKIVTIKICGCLYAAIDCVRVGVDKPIIITKEI